MHYKPYRIKVYEGETYYIEGRANNAQKFADLVAFFDQYLKDRLETPASATAQAVATDGSAPRAGGAKSGGKHAQKGDEAEVE